MEKALNTLEFLSHDEQTRQRYEARQKALHDYATAIETAKREGRQEGEQKGRQEGEQKGRQEGRQEGHLEERRAIATRLLRKGLSVEDTAELANLDVADVEAMAKMIP